MNDKIQTENKKTMKKINLLVAFALISNFAISQTMFDFKTKNTDNVKDRTMMLDQLRKKLYKEHSQEFVFVVNVFNVSNGYAWLKASVKKKDGSEINLDPDIPYDCCHVEALFKKIGEKWSIVKSGAFSTDVWYDGIWNETTAPKLIFGDDYHK